MNLIISFESYIKEFHICEINKRNNRCNYQLKNVLYKFIYSYYLFETVKLECNVTNYIICRLIRINRLSNCPTTPCPFIYRRQVPVRVIGVFS